MLWKQLNWIGLAAIMVTLSGCIGGEDAPTPSPIGMPNPASANCANLGGETVIETVGGGNQVGMCHLPDGRVCEEWALFREGVCEPADTARLSGVSANETNRA